jgi:hypothetical protein
MSLDDLPTELDSMIVSYLADDKKTLNALSKVSKSYRPLAEAYLYKDLVCCADDWESLALLLLTLVRREQLGLYIKSLKVDDGRHLDCPISPSQPFGRGFVRKLLKSLLRSLILCSRSGWAMSMTTYLEPCGNSSPAEHSRICLKHPARWHRYLSSYLWHQISIN